MYVIICVIWPSINEFPMDFDATTSTTCARHVRNFSMDQMFDFCVAELQDAQKPSRTANSEVFFKVIAAAEFSSDLDATTLSSCARHVRNFPMVQMFDILRCRVAE